MKLSRAGFLPARFFVASGTGLPFAKIRTATMDTKTTRPLLAILAAVACLGVFARLLFDTRAHGAADSPPAPAPIAAASTAATTPLGIAYATARLATVGASLKLPGTVSIPSSETATVSPRVQGQVVAVLARVGDRVAAGQTLARIRSLDIATAESAVRQARTQVKFTGLALSHQKQLAHLGSFSQKPLEDAHAALTTAQATLEGDRTGDDQDLLTVGQDQTIVQSDQSVVLQDQSLQNQDELDMAHDKTILDRQRLLYSNGIVSKQDLEAAQTTFDKDKEKISGDKLKVEGDSVKVHGDQEKVQSDRAKVEGDKLRLATDETQVRIAKAALDRETSAFNADIYTSQNVEQAQSAYNGALEGLQAAQDTLQIHGANGADSTGVVDIPAPIGGIVTVRNVNPGMNVDTSTLTPWQMFTISNPSLVYVDAGLSQGDLARVRLGMVAKVQTPDDPGASYTARISYIAPSVDPATHSVKVRCALENTADRLKDGMYVDVSLETSSANATVMVPSSAVQEDKDGKFVFVPKNGGGFSQRRVTTGRDIDGETEIASGLAASQRIVSDGSLLLKNQSTGGDD